MDKMSKVRHSMLNSHLNQNYIQTNFLAWIKQGSPAILKKVKI